MPCAHVLLKISQLSVLAALRTCSLGALLILWYKKLFSNV